MRVEKSEIKKNCLSSTLQWSTDCTSYKTKKNTDATKTRITPGKVHSNDNSRVTANMVTANSDLVSVQTSNDLQTDTETVYHKISSKAMQPTSLFKWPGPGHIRDTTLFWNPLFQHPLFWKDGDQKKENYMKWQIPSHPSSLSLPWGPQSRLS